VEEWFGRGYNDRHVSAENVGLASGFVTDKSKLVGIGVCIVTETFKRKE
jgi:hypothetical protein